MKTVRCDNCGQEGDVRHVTRGYGKGNQLFVIENVLIVSCRHCGESYLTADTLHKIARIKLHKQAIAVAKKYEIKQ